MRREELDPAVVRYVADSYPHNHNYRVGGGRLRPKWQLRRRFRRLSRLYPERLVSLLDVASSKGWFVMEAAQRPGCERALGIELHEPDLEASRVVAGHLGLTKARFEPLTLRELAGRIDEFGGPFQTVLLINAYQYLYFGSERSEDCVPDHDALFASLRAVCADRLLFSNRLNLADCQRSVRARAEHSGTGDHYNETDLLAAARRHFDVQPAGRLGRIPLLLCRPR